MEEVKTKSENYFLLEYKGEHLASGEDSDYKKAIGREWERLSEGGYYFKWVEMDSIDSVIGEVSKM